MKLRRLTALLLAFLLTAGLLPVCAAAAQPVAHAAEGGNLYFDTETGAVTGVDSSVQNLVIPQSIADVPVTAIADAAFRWSNLVSVTLPEGLTAIGEAAFGASGNLRSVTLPSTLKTIGDQAFNGCKNLKSVNFPQGLQTIGKRAFGECALTEVTLPSTLTALGDEAFFACGSLTKVSVPGSVKTIPIDAFGNCYKLASVTLGEGIEEIGIRAFKKAALTAVTLPKSMRIIGTEAFQQCPLTSLSLNEGLETVSQQAFSYTNLTELTLPSTLKNMGNYAFGYNDKVLRVFIPAGITRATTALFPLTALTDIYYGGSQTQWKEVGFSQSGVTIHCNSTAMGSSSLFTDVPESAWFHKTVSAVAKAGLVAGYADGTFSPNSSLSWVQAVVFAVRLNQYNNGEKIFSAADQTELWYQIYVDYAMAKGIIDSVPANPNATILRSAAAIIFAKVLKEGEAVNNIPNDYFSDVPAEGFMYDAVYKLARAGICNGKSAGVFAVSDPFTRSEVATIVARMASLAEPAKIS